MTRTIKNTTVMILFGCALMLLPLLATAVTVSPEQVNISATYNGKDVLVTGEVKEDEEAVIMVIGNSSEVELKQQGKVGGFLWMTVGHLSIADAPSAYLVYLPESINNWRLERDARWTDLNLGFSALQSNVKIVPQPANREVVFDEFIKLKTRDSLYGIVGDVIHYKKTSVEDKEFAATIHIPAKIPVADYEIRVLRITKNGKIAGTDIARLQLAETGFPQFISMMAFDNSLIYGILSVVIAIFAGLFMGILFRDRGGAH